MIVFFCFFPVLQNVDERRRSEELLSSESLHADKGIQISAWSIVPVLLSCSQRKGKIYMNTR